MTDFALPASAKRIDSGAARLLAAIEQTDNGAIGHLRFNLPEKHNVVDLEGWQAIPKIIEKLATHDNMRLIVLRGVGGKAFVAGADIAQFEEVLTGPDDKNGALTLIRRQSRPLTPLPLARCRHWRPLKAIALAAGWA